MLIHQVDAFTDVPFRGNPAAVCIHPEPLPEDQMQRIALEMNLSETAFLTPQAHGFGLRWFTPTTEVDLCGHATLASAHVLWTHGYLSPTATARFSSRSGPLAATRGSDGWITLDFPAQPPEEQPAPEGLLHALGLEAVDFAGTNGTDWLVAVPTEHEVRAVHPNASTLSAIGMRGVIVTAQAEGGDYDFVSRFFAPGAGVPEDPVTGSAHCCLAPYWQKRLGRDRLVGFQASARGGTVRVHPQGDRVHLSGQAVTVLRAELMV
ncbi:MAG: PhzF family phenazine biosynthesis protein [Bacteroidota bacterium]